MPKILKPNRRILIINNDTSTLSLYQKTLTHHHHSSHQNSFKITVASDGVNGLKKTQKALQKNTPFALVFIDLRLPSSQLDGIKTSRLLLDLDPRTYIVFSTAFAESYETEVINTLPKNILVFNTPLQLDHITQLADHFCKSWDRDNKLFELRQTLATKATQQKHTEHALTEALQKIHNQEQFIELAKNETESANKAKSLFLANMTHELRTPLHGILGINNLLKETTLDEDQVNYLSIIQESCNNLLRIVDDVLDFSRAETNQLDLKKENFNLKQLISSVAVLHQTKIQQKNLSIRITYDPHMPKWVHGDAIRIRQVLINLLNNAIKFTLEGYVAIQVQHEFIQQNTVIFKISVSDTGIGIPTQLFDSIFEKFHQADESYTRAYGGTGLGLSICKKLIQLQQGEMGVESVLDKGSTFWFRLTLPIVNPIEENPQLDLDECQFNGRVLLAEGTQTNIDITEELLSNWGCKFDIATDGIQAHILAQRNVYQLILMDTHMTLMNGLNATAKIRKSSKNKTTPIIAMTTNSLDQHRNACIKAGMNDFISKPITQQSLFNVLNQWLSLSEKDVPNLGINLKIFEQLKQEMEEDFSELIVGYIEDTTLLLERISENIQQLSCADLQQNTYRLTSSSTSIGATQFTKIIEKFNTTELTEQNKSSFLTRFEECQAEFTRLETFLKKYA